MKMELDQNEKLNLTNRSVVVEHPNAAVKSSEFSVSLLSQSWP